MLTGVGTRRLTSGDRELARVLFTLMAEVFEEDSGYLSDDYLDRLLNQEGFWAMAACMGGNVVGGLTAHTLPMTRTESSEIFIYDIAVRKDMQRKGVGRHLMEALFKNAAAMGIHSVFVPADNVDRQAFGFYRALGGTQNQVAFFTFQTGSVD